MTENTNINNNTDTNNSNSQGSYNPSSVDVVKTYTDNSTFNYENLIIKGNIATDIVSKVKNKERIEFSIAVNKWNSQRNMPITKWFNIVGDYIQDEDVELASAYLSKINAYLQNYQMELAGDQSQYQWYESQYVKVSQSLIAFLEPYMGGA